MNRKQSLERLHKRLLARRDFLRKKLGQQIDSFKGEREVGDVADAAIEGITSELDSCLADFESRELRLIEWALELMKEGRYGVCQQCGKKIPIARLNAVPFARFCVKCQEQFEAEGGDDFEFQPSWEKAYDFEKQIEERDVHLKDIE